MDADLLPWVRGWAQNRRDDVVPDTDTAAARRRDLLFGVGALIGVCGICLLLCLALYGVLDAWQGVLDRRYNQGAYEMRLAILAANHDIVAGNEAYIRQMDERIDRVYRRGGVADE